LLRASTGVQAEIGGAQRQELLARPAVMPHRRFVHGEERATLRVLDPHRLRIVLEEDPVALLGSAERIEHAHPLGDLAREEQRGGGPRSEEHTSELQSLAY